MRYPIKDKFWGWRMDPFEVFAHWDSWRTSLNLTFDICPVTPMCASVLLARFWNTSLAITCSPPSSSQITGFKHHLTTPLCMTP